MTLEQLLKLLKTDYIEVAMASDPYGSVEYLRRDELEQNEDLLSQSVTAIEPLAALKKKLFDSSAGDSDYVASAKILYGGETIEVEDEEVDYSQYSQSYEQPYEEEEESNPYFGFGNMPHMNIEEMRNIVNSEAFKNFMDSGIMDTIFSQGFPNIGQGFGSDINLSDILNSIKPKDDDETDE